MPESVNFDGTTFYRVGGDTFADQPYAVRIQVGVELSESQAEQLAGLVGYAYAKTGGERGNGFTQDTPNSIIYWCDTTKGRAYKRIDEFFTDAETMIVEGSPKRKTKGDTRLVDGLGDVGEISFWADNVYPRPEPPQAPATVTAGATAPACITCGSPVEVDGNGVATHRTEDGECDYEADGDHVALPDDVGDHVNPAGGASLLGADGHCNTCGGFVTVDSSGAAAHLSDNGVPYISDHAALLVTEQEIAASDNNFDARGFDREGVHRNGTLLDDNNTDVTGEAYEPSYDTDVLASVIDPSEDRVSRTAQNEVVKFTFRNKRPLSVQKLVFDNQGGAQWSPPRTTSVGEGRETLRAVAGLNPAARAIPESVAARFGAASGTCLLCGRALSAKASTAAGHGPSCRNKLYGN